MKNVNEDVIKCLVLSQNPVYCHRGNKPENIHIKAENFCKKKKILKSIIKIVGS